MISFDSEQALEQEIYEYLNDAALNPIDQSTCFYVERQTDVKPYGVTDLITIEDVEVSRHGDNSALVIVNVIELKNCPITFAHLAQIARYKAGLDSAIRSMKVDEYELDIEVKYTLVGTKTFPSSNDIEFLIQELSGWLTVYELTIDIVNGVSFTPCCGWVKTGDDSKIKSLVKRLEAKVLRLIDVSEEA